MTAQLDQILNYLDRDGVTELVLAAGQPMQFRRSGALVSITAAQLTRAQVTALVANTALAALLGQRGTTDVEHGKRKLRIEASGSTDAPALKISKAPDAAKPVPASPGVITERARRPSRAGPSPTPTKTPRPKHPTKAPRPRGSTRSPEAPLAPPEPESKITNRLTRSDIKFKPAGRGRPSNELPLDLDPTRGAGLELDPPTLDLAARAAAANAATFPKPPTPPAGLSLDLDDGDDLELGAPGVAAPAPTSPHRGGSPALDAAFGGPAFELDDLGPRVATSSPPAAARPPHAGGSPAIDASFGLPDPRAGGSPAIEATLALDDLGPRVSTAPTPDRYLPPPAAPAAVQPLGAAFAANLPVPNASGGSSTGTAAARTQPMPVIVPSLPPALRELVLEASRKRASDLHLAPNRPPCARVLGSLVPLRGEILSAAAIEALVMPLLDGRGLAQLERVGYSDFAFELPGGGRLRSNVSKCQGGVRGTFRIARERPPTLDELGLPAELAKVIAHHQGLVVIAGPSGHGKTTTLAALVDLVNATSAFHIITVEDPIEIVYPRKSAVVSQREVGPHTRSFAAALKGSLREDPDVIVIGELRDRETVEIALTAAETGHLVLATMSTPSAAKTIDRLVDMFPPDDQSQVRASIAGALRAIVAQRLLPSAQGDGVVAAVELLTGVLPLANMIRDDKLFQLPSLMQRGRAFGMIRLDDSLAELVRANKLATEVALAAADNRKELAIRLQQGTAAIPVVGPGRRP